MFKDIPNSLTGFMLLRDKAATTTSPYIDGQQEFVCGDVFTNIICFILIATIVLVAYSELWMGLVEGKKKAHFLHLNECFRSGCFLENLGSI